MRATLPATVPRPVVRPGMGSQVGSFLVDAPGEVVVRLCLARPVTVDELAVPVDHGKELVGFHGAPLGRFALAAGANVVDLENVAFRRTADKHD